GSGTPPHIAGELFKMAAGVDMLHVPYSGGGPALIDLLGGKVQVNFGALPLLIEHIKAGRLRALAVTGATRAEGLADLPTGGEVLADIRRVGEFLPGYEASTWFGIGAPTSTPADITQRLNNEFNAALADPNVRARFANLGVTVTAGSSADFGKFIADETEKWGKVVRFANIKVE